MKEIMELIEGCKYMIVGKTRKKGPTNMENIIDLVLPLHPKIKIV